VLSSVLLRSGAGLAARSCLAGAKLDEALRDFEEYHRLAPGAPEPYLLLSDAYEALGKLQASVENLEKGMRLDHENEEAKEVLARRLTELLRGQGFVNNQ